MKKITGGIVFFVLLCLCGGCKVENGQKNSRIAEIITATPKPEASEKTEQWISATGQNDPTKEETLLNNRKLIKEKLEMLEQTELSELNLYADTETSLLNSNVLRNRGYLTYDEDETIYFTDKNIGGIFVSDRNGKNRRQLTTDSGENLQIVGE